MSTESYNRYGEGNDEPQGKMVVAGKTTQGFDDVNLTYDNFLGKKFKASDIEYILRMADEGEPQEQAALFDWVLTKEPQIVAHLQTRFLAVLACDWVVNSKSGEVQKKEQDMFEAAGMYELLQHLLSAIPYGYGGSYTIWKPGGGSVTGFKFIHPQNFCFDEAGNGAIRRYNGNIEPIVNYPYGQVIFHKHMLKPGIPSTGGLLRCLVWLHFYKHYSVQHRARFLEKFGNPFILGKLSKSIWNDKTEAAKVLKMLEYVGIAGTGVVPEGTELEIHNGGSSSNSNAFKDFNDYIDDIYAILILGQLATKGESNGMSNGNAQADVRQDIKEADCRAIMRTVQKQLINPYELFTKGSTGQLFFKLAYEPPEDLDSLAKRIEILSNAGYETECDWLSKKMSIPLKVKQKEAPNNDTNNLQNEAGKDGKIKTRSFSSYSPISPETAAFSASFASREEYISRLTNNTLERLFVSSDAAAEFYRPFHAEIKKVFFSIDPESENLVEEFSSAAENFFSKYPDIYDNMDSKDIEKALQGAFLAGMIRGNL